jgi:hypothetical protein
LFFYHFDQPLLLLYTLLFQLLLLL